MKENDPFAMLIEAMAVGSSQVIPNQEARGQSALVNSSVLPKKMRPSNAKETLEKLGVVFGDEYDDLFVNATLPDGWRKVATDHSMWSNLVDNSGKEIASIFYKAAFYDRDAFLHVNG